LSEYLKTTADKFTFRVRNGDYYAAEDLWVRVVDGNARIGVTDYLQRTIGDIAFVELKQPSSVVERGGEIGTLETAKTTIMLASPVAGKIEEINNELTDKPELVNIDPYGKGWLLVIRPSNIENELRTLLNAQDYFKLMLARLTAQQKEREAQ
jgi:glycine cleavage system H protein